MLKNHTLLLLAWVLVVNAYGQTQQQRWYGFEGNSTIAKAIDFNTTGAPFVSGTVGSQNVPDYKGFNAAWDAQGKLIFYVINRENEVKVFDKNGVNRFSTTINPASLLTSKEIPIVKIGCGLIYHLLINQFVFEYNIISNECRPVEPNGFYGYTIEAGKLNVTGGSVALDYIAAAINKTTDNSYYLYSIKANRPGEFTRFLIQNEISVNEGIAVPNEGPEVDISQVRISGSNNLRSTEFSGYVSYLEVAPNTGYLAFADDYTILIYNLNSNGSIGSIKWRIPFGDSETDDSYRVSGLEFSADSRKLVFSRFKTASGISVSNAVGIIDLEASTPSISYIPNTNDYSRSEIELAKNGKLYTTSSFQLGEINLTSSTITNQLAMSIPLNDETNAGGIDCRVRVLPDQIDGVNNSDGFSTTATNYSTSTSWNWTYGTLANPFMATSGSVIIDGVMTFNNNTTITGMTFEFTTNAKILVNPGVKLTLRGCTLKSLDCAKMWEGIRVLEGGELLINDNFNVNNPNQIIPESNIYDAKIGIWFSGPTIAGKQFKVFRTNFRRNGTDIYLFGGHSAHMQFSYNKFNHKEPLKNQDNTSGGMNVSNTWYGKYGIHVLFSTPPGYDALFCSNNEFRGGLRGVYLYKASGSILNCQFIDMMASKGIGVQANQLNEKNNTKVLIQNCFFNILEKAVLFQNGKKIEFLNNVVHNTANSAVDLSFNNNCDLTVNGNTFNYCNSNAIILTNNAGQTSRAWITNNTITGMGTSFPNTGISIIESAKTKKGWTYQNWGITEGLRIEYNIMKNMGYGIKINGIVGGQPNQYPALTQSYIRNNVIEYQATNNKSINDVNSGIQLVNSDGLAVYQDSIYTGRFKTPEGFGLNRGISVEGCLTSLIKLNSLRSGRGISATGNCFGNNYACNIFNRNVNGITLDDHFLRKLGQIHGLVNVESRENKFNSTISTNDIRLQVSGVNTPFTASARRSRMISMVLQNKWLFTFSPLPKIQYNPIVAGQSIFGGIAPSPCGFTPGGDGPTNPGSEDPNEEFFGYLGLDWEDLYEHERELKADGQEANSFMSNLIEVEDLIANGSFSEAQILLNSLTTDNIIGQHYLTVFSIFLNANLPEIREFTETEVNTLTAIAEQKPELVGYAVYRARGILWYAKGMDFYSGDFNYINAQVGLVYSACMDSLTEDITGYVINEQNEVIESLPVEIDPSGYAFIPAYALEAEELDTMQPIAFVVTKNNTNYTSDFYSLYTWKDGANGNSINLCSFGKTTTSLAKATKQAEKVTLYPNPSNDILTLETTLPFVRVKVANMMGKQVYDREGANKQIPTHELANGFYLLELFDFVGSKIGTHKFVVQH